MFFDHQKKDAFSFETIDTVRQFLDANFPSNSKWNLKQGEALGCGLYLTMDPNAYKEFKAEIDRLPASSKEVKKVVNDAFQASAYGKTIVLSCHPNQVQPKETVDAFTELCVLAKKYKEKKEENFAPHPQKGARD